MSRLISRRLAALLSTSILVAACAVEKVEKEDSTACGGKPVAVAGDALTGSWRAPIRLNGSGSHGADGGPLSFAWTLQSLPSGSRATIVDAHTVNPTLQPDVEGTYVLGLVVTDLCGGQAGDTVTVTTSNSAPTAIATASIPTESLPRRGALSLDGGASVDPDGGPLTYAWTIVSGPPGAALLDPASVRTTFTWQAEGAYEVALVTSDGALESTAAKVTLTAANHAPVITSAGGGRTVGSHGTLDLEGGSATDPDGDPLTYAWTLLSGPPGASLARADTLRAAFTWARPGNYVVQLVASDGALETSPATITFSAIDRPPTASAGADRQLTWHGTVDLDGATATDADADPLTYAWTIVSGPPGASLARADTLRPAFTWTAPGTYVVQLVVNDGLEDAVPSTVTLTALDHSPVVVMGGHTIGALGGPVRLDGSASHDPDADALTLAWTLVARPGASAASIADAAAARTAFVPDVVGDYRVRLTVSAGGKEASAERVIHVVPDARLLDLQVVDAEYARATDRLVLLGTSPEALYVVDPTDAAARVQIPLPKVGAAVSVAPDGLTAVVGHDALLTVIDLARGVVTASYPVGAITGDVVLAGNGYAHVFPLVDQWVSVHSVRLSDGEEQLSTAYSIRAGTVARLQPGTTFAYGADRGLSPADIEKYDVSTGRLGLLYDSPYHGDYSMCGNLWFSEDGSRILTACGNTFRASAVRGQDMTYAGALAGGTLGIQHADHSSAAGRFLVVPYSGDESVLAFDGDTLAQAGTEPLPSISLNGTPRPTHGRFVFHSADGSRHFVVGRVDAAAGLVKDAVLLALP